MYRRLRADDACADLAKMQRAGMHGEFARSRWAEPKALREEGVPPVVVAINPPKAERTDSEQLRALKLRKDISIGVCISVVCMQIGIFIANLAKGKSIPYPSGSTDEYVTIALLVANSASMLLTALFYLKYDVLRKKLEGAAKEQAK